LNEAPALKDTLDSYGNRPESLLNAQTNLKGNDGSLQWVLLRESEGIQRHPSLSPEEDEEDVDGGWPSEEIPFPGWPRSEEDDDNTRLRCEFIEVTNTTYCSPPTVLLSSPGLSLVMCAYVCLHVNTQVSGAAVAADPIRFVKEFVLTSTPVVIRDLVMILNASLN
jgi:hypothetical protein